MNLKTVLRFICLSLASFSPVLVRAENIEFRMATLAADGSPVMESYDKLISEVKDKTDGRVTFKYYSGGQQGDEKDSVRKIKLGQLDGASLTSVGLEMIDQSIRALELPLLFESAEELDYTADKMWPYLEKRFESKGFKLMDRGEVGFTYFLSKNKVETLSDLKSQKLWFWGDDLILGSMYRKLSLNGVPLGVPEVEPALTSGRINAAYATPMAAVALNWSSKIKFMNSQALNFSIGATVVSISSWKKISATDQKNVLALSRAQAKKLRKMIRRSNESAEETMTRRGVTIVTAEPGFVSELKKQATAVQNDLVGKAYSKEELQMVLNYRNEYRGKSKPGK